MTFARSTAGHLFGGLVVAALVVFTVMAISHSVAPLRPVISFPQLVPAQPNANSGHVQGQTQATVPQHPERSVQSSSGAVPQQSASPPPAGATGPTGTGVTGFADAGPDTVGTAPPRDCGTKACPHLLK